MQACLAHGSAWKTLVVVNIYEDITIDQHFNPLAAGSIYICPMNRWRIATRSTLRIYVKGTSPTSLESAFDTLSPSASSLGIGHTWTKIRPFKRGSQLAAIDFKLFAGVPLPEASFGKPIVARLVD